MQGPEVALCAAFFPFFVYFVLFVLLSHAPAGKCDRLKYVALSVHACNRPRITVRAHLCVTVCLDYQERKDLLSTVCVVKFSASDKNKVHKLRVSDPKCSHWETNKWEAASSCLITHIFLFMVTLCRFIASHLFRFSVITVTAAINAFHLSSGRLLLVLKWCF